MIKPQHKSMPCFSCGKRLGFATHETNTIGNTISKLENRNFTNIFDNRKSILSFKNSFYKGITFYTYGEYGSQINDESAEFLFVICDECFVRNRSRLIVSIKNESGWETGSKSSFWEKLIFNFFTSYFLRKPTK